MTIFRASRLLLALAAAPWGLAAQVAVPEEATAQSTDLLAVRLTPGADPAALAERLGYTWVGPVGYLADTHLFRENPDRSLAVALADARRARLALELEVTWSQPQIPRRRVKLEAPVFPDPRLDEQWHLANTGQTGGIRGEDLNLAAAWAAGASGQGVVVGIVDDGVESAHPDLADAYRADLSYDYVGGDANANPSLLDDDHGTPVAGLVAARSNQSCGVGAAPGVDLASLRLISTQRNVTDADEANALSHRRDAIAIYNCSWGPDPDPGLRLVGPDDLTRAALADNCRRGRGGLGNIYLFAAGNSGEDGDNINYDGYNNLRYTISVGAVDHRGVRSPYSESGACLFVCAPSSGADHSIVTSDRTGSAGDSTGDCSRLFGGTSAACPLAAATVALMLEANPALGWRDVQHILARTAVRNDPTHAGWIVNGAGFHHNDAYGFGRIDASAAVALARSWSPRAAEQTVSSGTLAVNAFLNHSAEGVSRTFSVPANLLVEHVEVDFASDHSDWGQLELILESPAGTRSTLLAPHDDVVGRYSTWTTLTVRAWGENSAGTWKLTVWDRQNNLTPLGRWTSWQLRLHGTAPPANPNQRPQATDRTVLATAYPLRLDPFEAVSDPDGDPLELLSWQTPAHGQVEPQADGALLYTPLEGDRSDDRLGFTVGDGRGGTAQAAFLVQNRLPEARDDYAVTVPGRELILSPLDNDFDPLGTPVGLTLLEGPRLGTLVAEGSSQFRYQPRAGFAGEDRFTYRLSNLHGEDRATVRLGVADSADFALSFSRPEDVVSAGAPAVLNLTGALTVEAWINPVGWGGELANGYGRIVDKENFLFYLADADTQIYNDYSLVFFTIHAGGREGAANSAAGAVQLGRWQHVAVTYDGSSQTRFYVDGAAVATSAAQDPSLSLPSGALASHAALPLHIGNNARLTRHFQGSIRELRLWRRALAASEIADLHRQGTPPLPNGLAAAWDFDEGAGSVARDRTGGSPQATVRGARWVSPAPLPDAVSRYFPGVGPAVDGWRSLDWFGWFYAAEFPFLWHETHGWIYAGGTGGDDLWLWPYQPGDDWWFTGPGAYPWFYSLIRARWIWYLDGSAQPRRFYDPALGEFFEI